MIRHIVLWKFRAGEEERVQRFLDGLRNLQGTVPELLHSEVAVSIGGNYDASLVAEFASMEALEIYKNDPCHVEVSALCR
ncbi:MAG: Dabb family protein, partial [Oscillospiraceae bacterium]